MGVTPNARRLNRRFREFLAKGLPWAVAARKAGYSDTTIEKKAAVLKRRAGVQVQKRDPNGFVKVVRKVREWSPVSGREWLPGQGPSVEASPKPAEEKPVRPFVQDLIFEHPIFGDSVQTRAGGVIPVWARDEFSGGEYNAGSLPRPGSGSNWARLRAEQARFSRSYQPWASAAVTPSMIYEQEEERKPRGYKDAGVDVAGDALAGRFGFARLPIRGE